MNLHRKKARLHWLQIVTHVGSWIPLLVLIYDFLTNHLTINPIQAAEQRTGDIAIVILILSLACTPVNTLFGWTPVLKVTRALGLYAYAYAALHLFIFTVIDYGFDLGLVFQTIIEKQYTVVGITAFILLTLLAITSFDWWKVKLRKNWKRLHRLVYVINLLVVLHYAWAMKGDIFRLRGNILYPLLAGGLVLFLLAARLPIIRKRIKWIFRHPFSQNRSEEFTGSQPDESLKRIFP